MVAVAEFSNGLKHVETTIQIDPSLQIPRQRPHLSIVEAGDTRKFSGMERSLNPKHHHTPPYIITHHLTSSYVIIRHHLYTHLCVTHVIIIFVTHVIPCNYMFVSILYIYI